MSDCGSHVCFLFVFVCVSFAESPGVVSGGGAGAPFFDCTAACDVAGVSDDSPSSSAAAASSSDFSELPGDDDDDGPFDRPNERGTKGLQGGAPLQVRLRTRPKAEEENPRPRGFLL